MEKRDITTPLATVSGRLYLSTANGVLEWDANKKEWQPVPSVVKTA